MKVGDKVTIWNNRFSTGYTVTEVSRTGHRVTLHACNPDRYRPVLLLTRRRDGTYQPRGEGYTRIDYGVAVDRMDECYQSIEVARY